jgi:SsrA-binding protein
MSQNKQNPNDKLVAENRRARFDYFIEESLEVGLALTGTEVKSLRTGRASIIESYAAVQGEEIWLINANIPVYSAANRFNHEPKRARRILMHRRQINKFIGAVQREGRTLIPLRLYFNARGMAKLELGLAKGKKNHDKREAEKTRDWNREKSRVMRERG